MDAVQQDRLQQLYSDNWVNRLKAFVGRRYHDFGDWEGWFEEAHQNLALKLSAMPSEQEFSDALVFAVFKNELITVKRNRLGYPRPRAWLRQFSELGQDLFEWMCLKKLSRNKVIEMAMQRAAKKPYSLQHQASTETHADANDAEQAAAQQELLQQLTHTMIEKKECDGVRPTANDIDDDAIGQIAADSPTTEDNAEHAQLALILSMILGVNKVTDELHALAQERLAGLRLALGDEALLNDVDILILRCYYFQGMSQNDVAKQLKLPLQKIVRRREAAIKRIRVFMEEHGLTRESFALD